MSYILKNISYAYKTTGEKTIKIQDSVPSYICSGGSPNNLTSQVKSVRFGKKTIDLGISCLANSQIIESVTIGHDTNSIGDYAFYNCTNLRNVDILQSTNEYTTMNIGDYAFYNTAITDATIYLTGSNSYDFRNGSYSFSNCNSLTSVHLKGKPYVASYMFKDCTNLKNVEIDDIHSYIGRNSFENCTSLKEITLPSQFYMLSKYMFKGCVNLSKFNIETPSQLRTIEQGVFYGCDYLTSIVLPSSVSSLEYIDDNFLNGSKIKQITFMGLTNEDIATEYSTTKEYQYSPSCIYSNADDVDRIIDNMMLSGVPTIMIRTANNGCTVCSTFKKRVLNDDTFIEYLKNNTKYMFVMGYKSGDAYDKLTKYKTTTGTYYLNVEFYWKKEDGTLISEGFNGGNVNRKFSSGEEFTSYIDDLFKEYTKQTTQIIEIKPEISKFGSPLSSITIISNTGTKFVCSKVNETNYEPKVRVDYETKRDFRYGIWYYNAKQLKEYADTKNIPVFLEFSSAECDPCKDFKKNTFENKTFQEQVKNKKCLLCRVELGYDEKWETPNTQPFFCVNYWGDKTKTIPQTLYYWKKSNGEVISQAYVYHYRLYPETSNYQTILQRIDELTASYISSSSLLSPTITTVEDKKSFKYINEAYDETGRYFICDKRTKITDVSPKGGITIGGITENTIKQGLSTSFESGYTYLWYYQQDDYMYDRYGIIFSVSDLSVVSYIYDIENYDEDGENYQRTSDEYSNGTVYNMTETTQSISFDNILTQAKFNDVQFNIIKLGNNDESTRIKSIVESQDYIDFAATKDMLFLNVYDSTNNWTSNVAKSLRQFQTTALSDQYDMTKLFEPTSLSNTVPCLMVYKGCSQCTTDGKTIEEIKENINLNGKDLDFIEETINSYE